MINLIPNEEKKKMMRDFYFRFTIVVFFMLSFCIFIATIAMLPSYFVSNIRKNLANSKLEAQEKEQIPLIDQKAMSEVDELKKKLVLIENSEKNKFHVSQSIIKKIISKKTADIKITQIRYDNDPAKGKKISISGTASSRDKLLAFRKALEEDSSFTKVDLPVSNFIKGSDINFFLNLTHI